MAAKCPVGTAQHWLRAKALPSSSPGTSWRGRGLSSEPPLQAETAGLVHFAYTSAAGGHQVSDPAGEESLQLDDLAASCAVSR